MQLELDKNEELLHDFGSGSATTYNPAYWSYTCAASQHVADKHYISRSLEGKGTNTNNVWKDQFIRMDYEFDTA